MHSVRKCKHGHPLTPENLTKTRNKCRTCANARSREWHRKKRGPRKQTRGGWRKAFCKRGHPRTPENLRGSSCKLCRRERAGVRRPYNSGFCARGHARTPENVDARRHCKLCHSIGGAVRRQRPDVMASEIVRKGTPEYRREQEARRRRRQYHITQSEYDQMVLDAAGFCPLCGVQDNNDALTGLVVDHPHPPGKKYYRGKARGLICGACNRVLYSVEFRGLDHDWLDAANRYLDYWKGNA